MPMIVNLDKMLEKRKMNLLELSELVNVHSSNLSLLRAGKVRGVRFSTLGAICDVLDCDVKDILKWEKTGIKKNKKE